MTPFAWLIGFILPACAAPGIERLAAPTLMDLGRIERPATPNVAIAAPAGTQPAPDIVTPTYPAPAARLYAAVRSVAMARNRTFLAAEYPAEWQMHFVVRSAVLNFPDLVAAQVTESGPKSSTLVLYSRSVYGYGDFGVNRERLQTWLAALQTKIDQPGER